MNQELKNKQPSPERKEHLSPVFKDSELRFKTHDEGVPGPGNYTVKQPVYKI